MQHIDVAHWMLRRRSLAFPDVYRQNVVVMNNLFSQVVPLMLPSYQKKEKWIWEYMIKLMKGVESQFLAQWTGIDDVYWCQNYNLVHWYVIEASISKWCFTTYDSDVTVIPEKVLEELMEPWCILFPHLLWTSKLFPDVPQLRLQPGKKRPEFNWRRMQPDELPQTSRR